jgi:diketogulonate reductase-like aldo/keto reductase
MQVRHCSQINTQPLLILGERWRNCYRQVGTIPRLRKIYRIDTIGKVRSIGVSNFSIKNLDILLPQINIIPAVNQVSQSP